MRLVRDVRVCEYSFGYSRTESKPTVRRETKLPGAEMPVMLRLHDQVQVGDRGAHPVLCIEQANEGFYVRLDETTVRAWLERNGIAVPDLAPGVKLGGGLIEDFAAIQNDPAARFSRFLNEYRREGTGPTASSSSCLHAAPHGCAPFHHGGIVDVRPGYRIVWRASLCAGSGISCVPPRYNHGSRKPVVDVAGARQSGRWQ